MSQPRSTVLSAGDDYPRLRADTPVLRRGTDELQIGLDQRPSLILGGLSDARALQQVLTLVDGCHSLRDIHLAAAALGVGRELLDWTLRTLRAAGLLADDPSDARHRRSQQRVQLIGAGMVGKAMAGLLTSCGLGSLHLVDTAPPDPSLYPAAGAVGTQAEALRSSLPTGRGQRVSVANHWSKPETVRTDLTVVASDQLECDRVVSEGLVRADQPHLVLRSRAGGVVVGPLVVPGQTACLRCTDLTRCDADPAWPQLLPQLVRTRLPTAPALVSWAAGVATTQALAFLDGGRPETCSATIELSPTDYVTRWRSWPMHPACGCGWGPTAHWHHEGPP